MRAIMMAGVIAASALAMSSAFAQGIYQPHAFCLKTGSAQQCAYDSMAQCEAAKRGNADSCVANPGGPPAPQRE
jgi:hypothetical protein